MEEAMNVAVEKISENVPMISNIKKVCSYTWRYRKYFYKSLKFLRADIIVVGRPGVGKSVLIEHCKKNDIMIKNKQIESPSKQSEVSIIKTKESFKMIVVMQGQDLKSKRKDFQEALGYKKNKVLFIVVDFGYTEIRNESIKNDLSNETLESLREHNLKKELEELKKILQELKPFMDKGRGPKNIVVVLNKVDLFYSKLEEAINYYYKDRNSNFVKEIDAFRNEYGHANIGLEILHVCSLIQNYKWKKEEKESELKQTEEKNLIFSSFYKKLEKII